MLVFAGGSNLVIADTLTDLTAVQLANSGITIDGNLVRAEAGAVWDDVVVAAIEHGLGGLECLSGIPGSAGATPVQNVGAYGAEVSDTITRVRVLDRGSGAVRWVPGGELGFGYRTSVFKRAGRAEPRSLPSYWKSSSRWTTSGRSAPLRYGELTAALNATSGERADPQAVREAVLALRARKGMVLDAADHDTWSVGSFFTNPVVAPDVYERLAASVGDVDGPVPHYPAPDGVKLAAGWLVERAGFGKGYPDDPTGPMPAVHQARAGADQPRRRHRRGRDRAGPHRPRRGPRRVWHHTETRTCPARLQAVAAESRRTSTPSSTCRGGVGGSLSRYL